MIYRCLSSIHRTFPSVDYKFWRETKTLHFILGTFQSNKTVLASHTSIFSPAAFMLSLVIIHCKVFKKHFKQELSFSVIEVDNVSLTAVLSPTQGFFGRTCLVAFSLHHFCHKILRLCILKQILNESWASSFVESSIMHEIFQRKVTRSLS